MKSKLKMLTVGLLLLVLFVATGCSTELAEGTYTQEVTGYHGDMTVTTDIGASGEIENVAVGDNSETEGVGSVAIENIPTEIIENQSLDVDVVSGATITSDAIISGVAGALTEAGANLKDYNYTEEAETEEESWTIDTSTMPEKLETTGSVTITDAKKREVTIDLPISSYGVSTMDVIDYIIPLEGENAFDMLVASGQDGGGGIQKYSELYTDEVGDYMSHVGQISEHNAPFDVEMILAMDPDVLFVNTAMSAWNYALDIEDQLDEAGIKLVLINVPGKNLDTSVQDTMTILGQVFQEEEKADEVSEFMDTQYDLLASENLSEKTDQPTVYYEKSGYSEIYGSTATSASGWGLPIDIAGGDNIADAVLLDSAAASGSSSTLDPEYVLESDPDYIIMSGVNDGWLSILDDEKDFSWDILNRNGWNELQAVQNDHIYEFAHAESRSIFAFYPCLQMAKIFYPDEFEDVDPDAIMDEFFDRFMILDSDISDWMITSADLTSN